MHDDFLDELYCHHVASSRLIRLLPRLDDTLGELCSTANENLAPLLAQALLHAVTMAMRRVLLDGGATRCAVTQVTG